MFDTLAQVEEIRELDFEPTLSTVKGMFRVDYTA